MSRFYQYRTVPGRWCHGLCRFGRWHAIGQQKGTRSHRRKFHGGGFLRTRRVNKGIAENRGESRRIAGGGTVSTFEVHSLNWGGFEQDISILSAKVQGGWERGIIQVGAL